MKTTFKLIVFLCVITLNLPSKGKLIRLQKRSEIQKRSLVLTLQSLGEPLPKHYIEPSQVQIEQGRDLVEKGRTIGPNGKKSPYISKYFMCTSCHNSEREDPIMSLPDPNARLPYLVKKGLPFLQGSTFWGIVNRESWYNDDYFLKYGENVKEANNSLRKSIQLCAIECSQGRPLEQWEEDAILAYFWTLELKVEDLNLTGEAQKRLASALDLEVVDKNLVDELKSLYATTSPATFGKLPKDKRKGYADKGDPLVGKMVYENSCRHCHKEGGVSDYLLDYAPHTFKQLKKNLFKDNNFSIYQIVRKGTYASPGARPYMPHYPDEKMSDEQIESLRAYILQQTQRTK